MVNKFFDFGECKGLRMKLKFKCRLNLFTLVVVWLWIMGGFMPAHAGLEVGKTAPAFTLPTVDGKMLSLSQFRDRLVILHIWKCL
jgi:hypothetical protein